MIAAIVGLLGGQENAEHQSQKPVVDGVLFTRLLQGAMGDGDTEHARRVASGDPDATVLENGEGSRETEGSVVAQSFKHGVRVPASLQEVGDAKVAIGSRDLANIVEPKMNVMIGNSDVAAESDHPTKTAEGPLARYSLEIDGIDGNLDDATLGRAVAEVFGSRTADQPPLRLVTDAATTTIRIVGSDVAGGDDTNVRMGSSHQLQTVVDETDPLNTGDRTAPRGSTVSTPTTDTSAHRPVEPRASAGHALPEHDAARSNAQRELQTAPTVGLATHDQPVSAHKIPAQHPVDEGTTSEQDTRPQGAIILPSDVPEPAIPHTDLAGAKRTLQRDEQVDPISRPATYDEQVTSNETPVRPIDRDTTSQRDTRPRGTASPTASNHMPTIAVAELEEPAVVRPPDPSLMSDGVDSPPLDLPDKTSHRVDQGDGMRNAAPMGSAPTGQHAAESIRDISAASLAAPFGLSDIPDVDVSLVTKTRSASSDPARFESTYGSNGAPPTGVLLPVTEGFVSDDPAATQLPERYQSITRGLESLQLEQLTGQLRPAMQDTDVKLSSTEVTTPPNPPLRPSDQLTQTQIMSGARAASELDAAAITFVRNILSQANEDGMPVDTSDRPLNTDIGPSKDRIGVQAVDAPHHRTVTRTIDTKVVQDSVFPAVGLRPSTPIDELENEPTPVDRTEGRTARLDVPMIVETTPPRNNVVPKMNGAIGDASMQPSQLERLTEAGAPRKSDTASIRIEDADGNSTFVRVTVRGDQVRTSIVHPNHQAAGQMAASADQLRDALNARGFQDATVNIQSPKMTTEARAAPHQHGEPQNGEPREHRDGRHPEREDRHGRNEDARDSQRERQQSDRRQQSRRDRPE